MPVHHLIRAWLHQGEPDNARPLLRLLSGLPAYDGTLR
jgi:hypothetical protein